MRKLLYALYLIPVKTICTFKVYCFTGNIKNDLVKYFMQPVQNGLIIHLTNSLQNDINFVKIKFKPKNLWCPDDLPRLWDRIIEKRKIWRIFKKSHTRIEIASLDKNIYSNIYSYITSMCTRMKITCT